MYVVKHFEGHKTPEILGKITLYRVIFIKIPFDQELKILLTNINGFYRKSDKDF